MEFSNTIKIDDRIIGPGYPVFIIAEIGVNHNGDMNLARKTIDAAANAGADCVKFQTFRSEEFMADRDLDYEYETQGKTVRESMYQMFKRLEFPLDKHRELFDYARSRNVVPMTSVADTVCMHAALEGGATALKLASEDLINLPLLEEVSRIGVPVILSTGMADEQEIRDAMKLFSASNCKDALFMHCVSLYPTPDSEANIRRMTTLKKMTKAIVGYSDHTTGPEACMAAVALGACVLEKHFTLDRNLPGPDQSLSSDPAEFSRLVKGVRTVEEQLGSDALMPGAMEQKDRHGFRRSVVAARNLVAGAAITRKDLALKRPGNGIHPREMEKLIGRVLIEPVFSDEQLNWDKLK